jgi:hypothetical protein
VVLLKVDQAGGIACHTGRAYRPGELFFPETGSGQVGCHATGPGRT